MTGEEVLKRVLAEVKRAEALHPRWPSDQIHAAAIVAEEAGELVRAALDHWYHGGCELDMTEEATHTAATAIRFLLAQP